MIKERPPFDVGKEILCKVDEINERLKILQAGGLYPIRNVYGYEVGPSSKTKLYSASSLSVIEIVNDSIYNPDTLRVYLSMSHVPIPVLSGERIRLIVKEGVVVYGQFDGTTNKVVLIEYEV